MRQRIRLHLYLLQGRSNSLLSQFGVNEIQGNLLRKPVRADEIEALLQSSITIVLASENVVPLPAKKEARKAY